MGKGKGSPEQWVCEIRAGKIMYELTGVTEALAVEALKLAVGKLPIKCKIVKRSENLL
jgi:large subunit ribosomal protein L16